MPYNYDSVEHQLRLAAKSGDVAAVRTLLETEPDIDMDAAPTPNRAAIHLAMRYRHWEVVRVLLQHGATATLDDAETLEQLTFLIAQGVADPTEDQIKCELRYYRQRWSEQDVAILLGRLPDSTLKALTTIEEEEAKTHIAGEHWQMLKARMQPGDELWKFHDDRWASLSGGPRGYILLRQGKRIMRIVILR